MSLATYPSRNSKNKEQVCFIGDLGQYYVQSLILTCFRRYFRLSSSISEVSVDNSVSSCMLF